MQHLNVREYVESLRLAGNEWAPEILEALDYIDSPEHERAEDCQEELQALVPIEIDQLEPHKMAEWVSERLTMLETIEDHLKNAGLRGSEATDLDDAVKAVCDLLDL